jgi:starch phosphorylase
LFRQSFVDGWQIEEAEDWLTQGGNPWEFERPEASYAIFFGGHVETDQQGRQSWYPQEQVMAVANDMPIAGWGAKHVNTLRLWSAKPGKIFDLSHFNQGDYLQAAQQQVLAETLTRVLYPDDSTYEGRELRLKQEYFFTSASVQDLLRRFLTDHDDLNQLSDLVAIQLNDTHPAIMVPELMRLLMDEHGFESADALALTRKCVSYTNHTLLPEALESWPLDLFTRVLPRHVEIIRQIDETVAQEVQRADSGVLAESVQSINEGGNVRMGNLAFIGSHRVNGVSALHTRLMTQTVFADLHRLYPEKIVNVTNGVTPRRWLYHCNPGLANLITESIGDGWIGDLEQISAIAPYADDAGFRQQFMHAKQNNKHTLANEIKRSIGIKVDPLALFDVQIKRLHEYKRQLLNALQVVARYRAILENPQADWVPVVKIFSGKAAPSYVVAKLIAKLINDIAKRVNNDPVVGDRLKVVYLPNYNVSLAEIIIPGSDLSEQISTAGMEASGTGNMKLALNGALTLGTLDGANIEILERVGAENMFIFGLTAEQVTEYRNGNYRPADVIAGNPVLSAVLNDIGSGHYSAGDVERFKPIIDNLYQHDYFMVAADFEAYRLAQIEVEQAFLQRDKWARSAVLNTAQLGWFSSDRSIMTYEKEIWRTLS